MLRLAAFFLFSVVVLGRRGSLVDCQAHTQCGQCDVSCPHPLLSDIPKIKDTLSSVSVFQENLAIRQDELHFGFQTKLDQLECCKETITKEDLNAFQAKMDTQLEKVRSEMNGQLRGQMDRIEKEQQALRRSLIEDQAKMDTQLEKVRSEMNGQLQAILSKIEGLQAAPQQTHPTNNSAETPIVKEIPDKTPMNPTSRNQNIPAQFEQIGSRFFYIEHETKVTWLKAESTCREKGGYLATIKDWKEFYDIKKKLKKDHNYWLGINDVLKEGNYVSIASGKEAMYLKWARNNPEKGGRKDYVLIRNGYMYNNFEYITGHFICQADSET
ncbi:uncharacterized protein LOC123037992 [Drosophila rhopaloa]|uniref:C-type lectin domain-containing protein n=1 Tax=Drosophila rhopaloa TaxID=1041015 RepID=A0ABM5JEA8_DRORH|nr:uncharacterized protein LOC123037992 [Drosophila rhopaloa]